MKILVPVKRVIDPYVRVRIKNDHTHVEKNNVKMTMNPFDEIAVEEAIRLGEKGIDVEIILVSIGDPNCQETLRHGLALGGHRAIHITTEETLSPLSVAKILKSIVEKESIGLVLMGKQSIDGDHSQTGPMLAALLNWAQGTFASQIDLGGDGVTVTREIDGGLETLKLRVPAVITTDLRLNKPRYASLPNIMKAKNKKLETFKLDDLAPGLTNRQTVLKLELPPTRQAGKMVSSVEELVEHLKEAQVLPL